jgi:thiol-disulfide isomerase/thioredoxin
VVRVRVPRVPLLLAVASLALAACSVTTDLDATVVRQVADPLPRLEGTTLDGRPISTDDFAGEVLVINAWASWCLPCEAEQPQLVRLSEAYADRGVAFLGINHANQEAQAQAFVARHAVPYPSIADPSGRLAASLGYVGLPDTYVVDANGTVRFAVNGPTTAAQLGRLIDRVLAGDVGSAS